MSDATTTDRSGDARGDRGEAALATEAELRALCGRVRDQAKAGEYVEVAAARNEGTAVKVHGGQVESLTASVTASLGIRVVVDGRVGFAHAGSLADDVIADTLGQARENVAFAEVDPHLALARPDGCLLYTSDAADERSSVDLGGRRIIKKNTKPEASIAACH